MVERHELKFENEEHLQRAVDVAHLDRNIAFFETLHATSVVRDYAKQVLIKNCIDLLASPADAMRWVEVMFFSYGIEPSDIVSVDLYMRLDIKSLDAQIYRKFLIAQAIIAQGIKDFERNTFANKVLSFSLESTVRESLAQSVRAALYFVARHKNKSKLYIDLPEHLPLCLQYRVPLPYHYLTQLVSLGEDGLVQSLVYHQQLEANGPELMKKHLAQLSAPLPVASTTLPVPLERLSEGNTEVIGQLAQQADLESLFEYIACHVQNREAIQVFLEFFVQRRATSAPLTHSLAFYADLACENVNIAFFEAVKTIVNKLYSFELKQFQQSLGLNFVKVLLLTKDSQPLAVQWIQLCLYYEIAPSDIPVWDMEEDTIAQALMPAFLVSRALHSRFFDYAELVQAHGLQHLVRMALYFKAVYESVASTSPHILSAPCKLYLKYDVPMPLNYLKAAIASGDRVLFAEICEKGNFDSDAGFNELLSFASSDAAEFHIVLKHFARKIIGDLLPKELAFLIAGYMVDFAEEVTAISFTAPPAPVAPPAPPAPLPLAVIPPTPLATLKNQMHHLGINIAWNKPVSVKKWGNLFTPYQTSLEQHINQLQTVNPTKYTAVCAAQNQKQLEKALGIHKDWFSSLLSTTSTKIYQAQQEEEQASTCCRF